MSFRNTPLDKVFNRKGMNRPFQVCIYIVKSSCTYHAQREKDVSASPLINRRNAVPVHSPFRTQAEHNTFHSGGKVSKWTDFFF